MTILAQLYAKSARGNILHHAYKLVSRPLQSMATSKQELIHTNKYETDVPHHTPHLLYRRSGRVRLIYQCRPRAAILRNHPSRSGVQEALVLRRWAEFLPLDGPDRMNALAQFSASTINNQKS
jgi:hypothetical protein